MLEFQKKEDGRIFSGEDREEFKNICHPVVEYLQKKHDPHTQIIIGWTSAVLSSGECGVAYDAPD